MRHMWRLRHRRVSSLIKSIQRGTVSITGSATSNTATIAAVDVANALIFFLGHSATGDGSDDWRAHWPRIELTNATTVTAVRNQGGPTAPSNVTVSFVVVEFYQGVIKSIQRGTVSGATATVTAVNTTLADLIETGWEYTGASSITGVISGFGRLALTDATTITRTGAGNHGYQLVEWQ